MFNFKKNEFVNSFREGARVWYESRFYKDGSTKDISDANTWGEH